MRYYNNRSNRSAQVTEAEVEAKVGKILRKFEKDGMNVFGADLFRYAGRLFAAHIAEGTENRKKVKYPFGRPYKGLTNTTILLDAALETQKRHNSDLMEPRFIACSKVDSTSKAEWRIHPEAKAKAGAVKVPIFVPQQNRRGQRTGHYTVGYVYNLMDTNLFELGVFPSTQELPRASKAKKRDPKVVLDLIQKYPHKLFKRKGSENYSLESKKIAIARQKDESDLSYLMRYLRLLNFYIADLQGRLEVNGDMGKNSEENLISELMATYVMSRKCFFDLPEADEKFHKKWITKAKKDTAVFTKCAAIAMKRGDFILNGKLPYMKKERKAEFSAVLA